jgi:hypothetical protein
MTCPVCHGSQWIQKKRPIDPRIYGEPRMETVAVPCPHCTRPTAKYLEPK